MSIPSDSHDEESCKALTKAIYPGSVHSWLSESGQVKEFSKSPFFISLETEAESSN